MPPKRTVCICECLLRAVRPLLFFRRFLTLISRVLLRFQATEGGEEGTAFSAQDAPAVAPADHAFSVIDALVVLESLVDPTDDVAIQHLDPRVLLDHLVGAAGVDALGSNRDPGNIKRRLVRAWRKTKKLSSKALSTRPAHRRRELLERANHKKLLQAPFEWPWQTRLGQVNAEVEVVSTDNELCCIGSCC